MDIIQLDDRTFQTEQRGKTFTLRVNDGYCHVMSVLTADPSAKVFWGLKTFRNVAEVDSKYKAFRGIAALLEA